MGVISLRLRDDEIQRIEKIAKEEKKDKSTVVREIIDYGLVYLMIRQYKERKLSLERLSKELNLSVSETIDFLSDWGIQAPIDYDDYLEGYEVFKRK